MWSTMYCFYCKIVCFVSVFLLASFFWILCFSCLTFCSLFLSECLNSLWCFHFVEFCALVGLLEVELPLGSGCLWNNSTECCQFNWIPPFPGVLHWRSMLSWSKVVYRCSVVSIFSETDCLLWVVCWPHSMPSTCNRQYCGTVVHIQLANETVVLFTCASLNIGGWCTLKHRHLGYHVACPPWLMCWSKGVLCSALTLFLWLGICGTTERKIFFIDFVMFQCLASCLVSDFGWFWWLVSVVALISDFCFKFWLKLIVTFKWLHMTRVTCLCGHLSERKSLFF